MIRTYENKDGTFCASEDGVWVCGAYASRDAAELACKVDPQKLVHLWQSKLASGGDTLTLAELEAL